MVSFISSAPLSLANDRTNLCIENNSALELESRKDFLRSLYKVFLASRVVFTPITAAATEHSL